MGSNFTSLKCIKLKLTLSARCMTLQTRKRGHSDCGYVH